MPQSTARTAALGLLAVLALLTAFALSFWWVVRGVDGGYSNRAQSQIRTPAEEAAANKNWNPNQSLMSRQSEFPPPGSWADTFGRALAYTRGVDADRHLYPAGDAPAPGSVIEGDDAPAYAPDALSELMYSIINPSGLELESLPAPTLVPAAGHASASAPEPRNPHAEPAAREQDKHSPVSDLLNR